MLERRKRNDVMAKRGGIKHLKRIAAPHAIAITDKKKYTWISKAVPGPHDEQHAVPLGVLIRTQLSMCNTNREGRKVLNQRVLFVDGRIRTEDRFPIGFMDIVSIPSIKKYYRMLIDDHKRIVPAEINEKEAKEKIAKVVVKNTGKKGQIMITLHDGKTLKGDNNVHVGDSVVLSVPENKILRVLKLKESALCYVKDGKHAGTIATLESILKGNEGENHRAQMKGEQEFITALKHLFVIEEGIKGVVK